MIDSLVADNSVPAAQIIRRRMILKGHEWQLVECSEGGGCDLFEISNTDAAWRD